MMKGRPSSLDELIERQIAEIGEDEAIDHIGLLIDTSFDEKSEAGTTRAFELLEQLRTRKLSPAQEATAHYFTANAWENRRHQKEDAGIWAWEQPEIQAQILELRRAEQHQGFAQLPVFQRCRIRTNLANQFGFIGRFIEAGEARSLALEEDPRFAMALGNQGIGLMSYAQSLYDPGHAGAMLTAAHDLLTSALAADARYESAGYLEVQAQFRRQKDEVARRVNVAEVRKRVGKRFSVGRSASERSYRTWCLSHRLFLNPLNDLGPLPIAANDVLTLPSLRGSLGDERVPRVIGFYNQMKQEYVSARFTYYEGLRGENLHFSDRDVLLYDAPELPHYSLAAERQRAAFRTAYSLLDKIAFFLNDYLDLGIKPQAVSFRKLWYAKGQTALLPRFEKNDNWPLRGLFWLSKDLFEEKLQASTDPEAKALDRLRNFFEHRYVQIYEDGDRSIETQAEEADSEYRYLISRGALAAKTLRLLRLSRAALIYLSLAVHREERKRSDASGKGIAFPIKLTPLDDDWKR
ncbi:MAG: LA2681 family HEPN domain-containing protein [Pseudomonadota bacterium]